MSRRPRSPGRPTLDEVAARAGVGRGTVSRVVNGSPQVSPAAREAVERAITELGYVPNRAARALVTHRTDSVALVVSESEDRVFGEPFFAGIVRGVSSMLAETPLQLWLAMAQSPAERARLTQHLTSQHVDGVLLLSLHDDDPLPALLAERGLPVVLGGRPARMLHGSGSPPSDSRQAGSVRPGSGLAGSGLAGSGLAGSGQAGSGQAGSGQAGSPRSESARSGLLQSGSAQSGPVGGGAGATEPRMLSFVDVDNTGGARLATEHLLGTGRRVVSTITGPQDMAAGVLRLEGYREAIEKAGHVVDPALIAYGDFSEQSGVDAMRRLLAAHPDIDAVFAASDSMALGAMRVLREAGRRVPIDVGVVGFDDSVLARQTDPALTSVHQPVEEMGRAMAQLLYDRIRDVAPAEPYVILGAYLVHRDSA